MNALSGKPVGLNPLMARLIEDVTRAADRPLADRDGAVAAALAPYLGDPALLAGRSCPCGAEKYTRHLLHADPVRGFAMVAIAWAPGQMSPVHGHLTWCAFGIHAGWLTETFFRPEGDTARPTACCPRRPGDISHAPADPAAIHRIANLGTADAVSIHVYGVDYDRFGDGVNRVWAA